MPGLEVGGVSLVMAFVAGVVSCLSPCVLPLAPVYLSNLVGSSAGSDARVPRAAFGHALAFMLGFVILFIGLGVSVGLAGYFLRDSLPLVAKAGGVFLVLLGLHMSKLVPVSFFYRGFGFGPAATEQTSLARSFLAGASISAGWLPCIGPTLGSILTLAVVSGTVIEGGVLLLVYALGLALPFVVVGLVLGRTPTALRWLNRHEDKVSFAAGIVMILMGILLFTGTLQRLNSLFNFSGSGLGANV